MNQVLFGDPFVRIVLHLAPKNLHILTQVCSTYKQLITENVMLNNAKHCIKNRLREILDNKYDDFMKLCCDLNASVEGSFVAECILGERWNDRFSNVRVKIPKHRGIKSDTVYYTGSGVPIMRGVTLSDQYWENNYEPQHLEYDNMISNFIEKCQVESTLTRVSHQNDNNFTVYVQTKICHFANGDIRLDLLYKRSYPISTKKFINIFCSDDALKNIYNVKRDQLYVHKMSNLLNKRANVPRRRVCLQHVPITRRRGFEYYDEIGKKCTDDDILAFFDDIVKVKVADAVDVDDFLPAYCRLSNNVTFYNREGKLSVAFHIVAMMPARENNDVSKVYISKCTDRNCHMIYFYNNPHYHGTCFEGSGELKNKHIIFIVV